MERDFKYLITLVAILMICIPVATTAETITGSFETAESHMQNVEEQNEMLKLLMEIQGKTCQELGIISNALGSNAKEISETGFSGPEVAELLGGIVSDNQYIMSGTVSDRDGIILLVKPDKYAAIKGMDISSQQHVITLLDDKWPVMSKLISIVEGVDACLISYPLYNDNGCIAGFTSLTFEPKDLLSDVIEPLLEGTDYSATVIQTDGLILYDSDESQIGKAGDDPLYEAYPELQDVMDEVEVTWTGSGVYKFIDTSTNQEQTKEAFWTTIWMHGTKWRIVLTHVI